MNQGTKRVLFSLFFLMSISAPMRATIEKPIAAKIRDAVPLITTSAGIAAGWHSPSHSILESCTKCACLGILGLFVGHLTTLIIPQTVAEVIYAGQEKAAHLENSYKNVIAADQVLSSEELAHRIHAMIHNVHPCATFYNKLTQDAYALGQLVRKLSSRLAESDSTAPLYREIQETYQRCVTLSTNLETLKKNVIVLPCYEPEVHALMQEQLVESQRQLNMLQTELLINQVLLPHAYYYPHASITVNLNH